MRMVQMDDREMKLADWARVFGINAHLMASRFDLKASFEDLVKEFGKPLYRRLTYHLERARKAKREGKQYRRKGPKNGTPVVVEQTSLDGTLIAMRALIETSTSCADTLTQIAFLLDRAGY